MPKPSTLLCLLLFAGCTDAADTDVATDELVAEHGLSAEYFAGTKVDLHQTVLARIDPAIDFQWGFGSPDPAVPADQFAVRWTGTLEPRFSETYTLALTAVDDTAQVWIDGQLVIDHEAWWQASSATVSLVAGHRHALQVVYTEAYGAASIQLSWSSASQARQVIPTAQLRPATSQPAQPATGPGGASGPNGACVETRRAIWWNDDLSYWVFEPASPAPSSAPVVVFDHGWMGNDPKSYGLWLDHLCRKGNIVIFPRYQSLLTLPAFFTSNATWSVLDALVFLAGGGHVVPDVSRGIVVIGHSAGGTVAVDMAAAWPGNGLPRPVELFAVAPATPSAVPYVGLDRMVQTPVVCLAGNDDTIVGRVGCDAVFDGAPQVTGKRYLWQYSDATGVPALVADHFQPSELEPYSDALDYFLTWRIADAMTDCAWRGTSCDVATPAAPAFATGTWSDGTPMTPVDVVIDRKPACPVGSTAVGCTP